MSADWSGLASAFQNIVNQKKADRRATSHEELQANTEAILGDVRMLQDRRSKLDPKSPTYSKDVADIDANLHSARQAFTDMYHPEKNPGALEKLGGFLQSHLGGKKETPKTPGEAKKRFDLAALDASAAGPGQSAPQNDKMQDVRDAYKKTFGVEMPKEKEQAFFNHLYGGAALEPKETPTKYQGQLTETTDPKTGQKHYWRVPQEAGGKPEEVDFQGQAVSQKGGGPKVGSFGDFMVQGYGPHPTAQQYQAGRRLWAQSNAGTTVGEHVVMVPQPDGSVKAITVQTTSTKSFGGAPSGDQTPAFTPPANVQGLKVKGNINLGGRPILHNSDGSVSSERSFSIGTDQGEVLIPRVFDGKDHTEQEAIEHYKKTGQHMGIFDTPEHADAYAQAIHNRHIPRTPGEAKQRIAPHAGVVGSGETVGGKLTAPQAKAETEYNEAVKLASIADQVSQKPDDAINQKRLAVSLERTSAGRFTTQALDYIIRAGWGNTLEQWANNPSTGALPKDVMRQLVDGAHQNLKAADDARKAAHNTVAAPSGGGTSSGKAVSLAKAKTLPQNAGKTDDEIRKDIEAHGHKVVD